MKLSVDGANTVVYRGGRAPTAGDSYSVFIHGGGLDHSVWLLQSRYFAHHGFNVLVPDLPGHGGSMGELRSDIPAMACWVIALLDAAEVESAALIGHSMGSLVALETAALYPERVTQLSLLGAAAPMMVTDPLLQAARQDKHAAFDMITLWGHAKRSQIGGNPAPGMWMVGGALRLLERSAPGVLFNDLNACNEYRHGLASAAKVKAATQVVMGIADQMTPPRAVRPLAAALPSAKVCQLNCGHMMLSEDPDGVLDALKGFLL